MTAARLAVVAFILLSGAAACSNDSRIETGARPAAGVPVDGPLGPRRADRPHAASTSAAPAPNPYRHQVARGDVARLLEVARRQWGVEYVYGAAPRDPDGLAAIGTRRAPGGFDCSSFVAYAFQVGLGIWISGNIAHTDEIWTQGGALPLTPTPGETDLVIRGTGAQPPPGGYRPGDILLTRWGAGGFWGHVVLVSERGRVIEAFPPDVHEDSLLTRFLAEGAALGWVRVKGLA